MRFSDCVLANKNMYCLNLISYSDSDVQISDDNFFGSKATFYFYDKALRKTKCF